MTRQRDAEILAEAIRVLMRTFTIDDGRIPPAEGKLKYNASDFQTIGYVAEKPGCMASDVARFLGVSPTTATSILDRLERQGLLIRTRPTGDRRTVALTLTPAGREVHQAIRRQDAANCMAMLNALPPSDRAAFLRSITRIADALEMAEAE
jgi:DNA-binding MarR family transcriptional regulator